MARRITEITAAGEFTINPPVTFDRFQTATVEMIALNTPSVIKPVSKKLKYEQFMGIVCMNPNYGCSTAIIGNFKERHFVYGRNPLSYTDVTFNEFCLNIDSCMKRSLSSITGNHLVSSYSFVLASTIDSQPKTREWLTELGFVPSVSSHNKKNETNVILFIIPVKELIAKLKSLKLPEAEVM